MENSERFLELLKQAKELSREYHELTGRPLGCTGEMAEYEAIRILNLELAPVRQSGYDAVVRYTQNGRQRLQIKGRCILPGSKPGQQMGRIDCRNKEWDAVILVLLDERFDAVAIYEADREAVVAALEAPGSKSRNERGALGSRSSNRLVTRYGAGSMQALCSSWLATSDSM